MAGAPSQAPEADKAELERLEITRITIEQFRLGPYRYSRLADALAQARRREAGGDQE